MSVVAYLGKLLMLAERLRVCEGDGGHHGIMWSFTAVEQLLFLLGYGIDMGYTGLRYPGTLGIAYDLV